MGLVGRERYSSQEEKGKNFVQHATGEEGNFCNTQIKHIYKMLIILSKAISFYSKNVTEILLRCSLVYIFLFD